MAEVWEKSILGTKASIYNDMDIETWRKTKNYI